MSFLIDEMEFIIMSSIISGSEVRQLRLRMDLTPVQFSDYCEVALGHIHSVERGTVPVTVGFEKSVLFAFARWSGAYRFGVSFTLENTLRQGVKNCLNK